MSHRAKSYRNSNQIRNKSRDEADEIYQLRLKFPTQLTLLKELFPNWSDEDLLFALEDSQGELELTVDRISEGFATQWGEVKTRKVKKEPMATISTSTNTSNIISPNTTATRAANKLSDDKKPKGSGSTRQHKIKSSIDADRQSAKITFQTDEHGALTESGQKRAPEVSSKNEQKNPTKQKNLSSSQTPTWASRLAKKNPKADSQLPAKEDFDQNPLLRSGTKSNEIDKITNDPFYQSTNDSNPPNAKSTEGDIHSKSKNHDTPLKDSTVKDNYSSTVKPTPKAAQTSWAKIASLGAKPKPKPVEKPIEKKNPPIEEISAVEKSLEDSNSAQEAVNTSLKESDETIQNGSTKDVFNSEIEYLPVDINQAIQNMVDEENKSSHIAKVSELSDHTKLTVTENEETPDVEEDLSSKFAIMDVEEQEEALLKSKEQSKAHVLSPPKPSISGPPGIPVNAHALPQSSADTGSSAHQIPAVKPLPSGKNLPPGIPIGPPGLTNDASSKPVHPASSSLPNKLPGVVDKVDMSKPQHTQAELFGQQNSNDHAGFTASNVQAAKNPEPVTSYNTGNMTGGYYNNQYQPSYQASQNNLHFTTSSQNENTSAFVDPAIVSYQQYDLSQINQYYQGNPNNTNQQPGISQPTSNSAQNPQATTASSSQNYNSYYNQYAYNSQQYNMPYQNNYTTQFAQKSLGGLYDEATSFGQQVGGGNLNLHDQLPYNQSFQGAGSLNSHPYEKPQSKGKSYPDSSSDLGNPSSNYSGNYGNLQGYQGGLNEAQYYQNYYSQQSLQGFPGYNSQVGNPQNMHLHQSYTSHLNQSPGHQGQGPQHQGMNSNSNNYQGHNSYNSFNYQQPGSNNSRYQNWN